MFLVELAPDVKLGEVPMVSRPNIDEVEGAVFRPRADPRLGVISPHFIFGDFRLVLLRDLDRLAILEDPILEAEGPTRPLAPPAQRELAAPLPSVTDPRQARTLLPREGAGELLLEVVEDLFISPGKLRSLQGVCSVDGGRDDDIGVTPPRDLIGVVDDLVDLGLER